MLTLHTGNRLEDLADLLAEHCQQTGADVFTPFLIAVQSNGMARWLSMRLADRNKIAANLRFPFPASLVWEIMGAILAGEDIQPSDRFRPESLSWGVYRVLGEDASSFPELQQYLQQGDLLSRFELSCRIADVLDQYLLYRPDWIASWEQGEQEHWQVRIWRSLLRLDSQQVHHRARMLREVQQRLPWTGQATLPEKTSLPCRIFLFGIPSLPPAHLDILCRVARHIPVDLYQMAPSSEYAGDLLTPGGIAQLALRPEQDVSCLETGNPLLASLGTQWAEFQAMVQDYEPVPGAELYYDPGTETVLSALQSDILNLRDRGGAQQAEHPPLPGPESDSPAANISVHSCHSPLREVEVLYEQLLALFQAHPELRPSEVAVTTPDIDTYTPFIQAVFDHPEDRPRIPYRIADQGLRSRSPVVEAAFRLLELPDSRFTNKDILDLLEMDPVLAAVNISSTERDRIREWVRDTGIRWGIDKDFLASHGVPPEAEHTWQRGLDRQILGYALPGNGLTLWNGLLPYSGPEGEWAQTLGRFQAFARDLFRWRDTLVREHLPWDWTEILRRYLDRFLSAPGPREETDAGAVFQAVTRLAACAEEAGMQEPISRDVVLRQINSHINLDIEGVGFPGNGVTFCSMIPMRAIPFTVVAMLGMNQDSFPRLQSPASFDLMAEDRRAGDRSRREDDRYLFLESLLSARKHLYISYVGRDIRENTTRPPSVLVSELLEVVDRTFQPPPGYDRYSHALTTVHPLQPFSPRYFQDIAHPSLFSYSAAHCRAAQEIITRKGQPQPKPTPFLDSHLPEPEESWRTLSLQDITAFYRHPVRYLLRQRLGLNLETAQEELQEQEPFTLAPLEEHLVRNRILECWRCGGTTRQAYHILRAEGFLPHGQPGERAFSRARAQVERFISLLQQEPEPDLPPVWLELEAGPVRILDRLSGICEQGLLAQRCGRVNESFALDTRIRHLALAAAEFPEVEHRALILSLDQQAALEAIGPETARQQLQRLGEFLWQGLKSPLPFPPRSALAYARSMAKVGNREKAMKSARDIWFHNEHNPYSGEELDPYFHLVFGHMDPLREEGDTFRELAELIFQPIAEVLQ